MSKHALPVLMYHHINDHTGNLVTISPQAFEKQMAHLANKGYKTLDMAEALCLLKGEKPLTGKEVLITFDDGFLDNWVYAYPILKKYNLKAVIFVVTGFVENEGPARPHLGHLWEGKLDYDRLPEIKEHNDFDYQAIMVKKDGGFYMRWSELARMEADGVIDVQAHSHFHGDYFTSDKISGFNSKTPNRLAMTTGGDSRLGIPIYEKKPALAGRRYKDDPRLRDYLAQCVQTRGGAKFFDRPKSEWQTELQEAYDEYIKHHDLNEHYETVDEYERRVKKDLSLSRRLIEDKLNKKCLSLAWPWGVYSKQLLKWAQETGYEAAFTTEKGCNTPGCDLLTLKRCDVKKGDLRWFARQLSIYSRPGVSGLYLKIRRGGK